MSCSSFVTKTFEEDIGPRQVAFLYYKQTVSATTDNELKTMQLTLVPWTVCTCFWMPLLSRVIDEKITTPDQSARPFNV